MIKFFVTFVYLLVFQSFLFLANVSNISDSDLESNEQVIKTKQQLEKMLFSKRVQQSQAIKDLIAIKKYEQRYKIVKTLFEKLIESTIEARSKLESNAFIPNTLNDSNLEEHQTSLKLILTIVHNCAFMSEVALKLPEISERILKSYNNWKVMIYWCISFSNSTGVLDKNTFQLFHLGAQQLNIIPKEETFFNPYSKINQKSKESSKRIKKDEKKIRKKIKKEPRLSKKLEL